jgi:tetratricopeptide (TPR) repeat protein
LNQNRLDDARVHYEARVRAEPWNADALADYGTLLANLRRLAEARRHLERALWIRPDFPRARQNLDTTLQLLRQKG